jgi:hypothetical protein
MRKAILMMVLAVIGCSKLEGTDSINDVYLLCKGEIYFLGNDPFTMEKQDIAAHIKSGKINFSGNTILLGENIQICTPSADQPYFDSESCENKPKNDKKRKYGTYNKVTGELTLTNLISENRLISISGTFKCNNAKPLMK